MFSLKSMTLVVYFAFTLVFATADWPTEGPTDYPGNDCPRPTPPRPTDAPRNQTDAPRNQTDAPRNQTDVPTDAPTDGPQRYRVELHGGSSYYGNVFANNRLNYFGPVCDDLWGCDEANVVCRELGFDYAAKYYGQSAFGQVPSHYAMDNVNCGGYEGHLQDCYYTTYHDCGSYEGAGVKCWMWDWNDTTDIPTDRPTHRPTDGPTHRPTDGPTDSPTSTTDRPSSPCPHGWLDADYLGCFKLINDGEIIWPMAQQACEDVGGYLAQPDSDEKYQLLTSLIEIDETYEGYANWWIGLTDQGHEGSWEWAHSAEILDSNKDDQWGHGSPHQDDNNHKDCVIFRHSDGYRWADVDCFADSTDGVRNAFICEKEN